MQNPTEFLSTQTNTPNNQVPSTQGSGTPTPAPTFAQANAAILNGPHGQYYNQNQANIASGAVSLPNYTPISNPVTTMPSVANTSVNIPQTLDSSVGNATSNYNLPTPATNTANSALAAQINSIYPTTPQTSNTPEANNINDLKNQKQSYTQKLLEMFTARKGQAALTSDAYNNQDLGGGKSVNQAQSELNDIRSQIAVKQRALKNISDSIYNSSGLTREQANQQASEQTRQGNSELADLSVIESAKMNNYTQAKQIADMKVSALLENDKNTLDALKFGYDNVKEDLTAAEDKQFKLNMLAEERNYNDKKSNLEKVNAIGLEYLQNGGNSLTAKKILASQSPAEALAIAGNVLGSVDRNYKYSQMSKNLSGGFGGSGTGDVSSLSQAVISNPSLFYSFTPTQKAQITAELTKNGYDISQLQNTKLSASQQDDIAQMNTVSSLIDRVLELRKEDGSIPGVGRLGYGSAAGYAAQLGFGSEEGKIARADLGNIKGTIAKLRGGTSFTANEEKLLNTYTPTINDSSDVAVTKLQQLKDFIAQKNANLIGAVNTNTTAGQIKKKGSEVNVDALRAKYNY